MKNSNLHAWYNSTFGHAALGAGLLWLALPPCDLWPLAWIAPVWWVLLIRKEELPGRRPYRALWIVGFCFWMGALHWLRLPHWTTSLGWVALSFYQAFYLPIFVGLCRVAVHRLRISVVLAAPIVWAGLELARGHLLTGITMGNLGHTQYRFIELIQLSDLCGAYGVSFVVMFAAACFGRMVRCDAGRFALWPLAPAVLVVSATLGYGQMRMSHENEGTPLRVALIQGSIDSKLKSEPGTRDLIHDHYLNLSREAVAKYPDLDLIVWPETMFRDPLFTLDPDLSKPDEYADLSDEEFRRRVEAAGWQSRNEMAKLAADLKTALLLGVDRQHFGPQGLERFNSAVFVTNAGEVTGYYDKIHRVMFGEYVPFAEHWPWLQGLTPLPVSLQPGNRAVAFEVGGLRFAPNICYESVLPHVIRRQVLALRAEGAEPDVLVNLTNDGWFRGSSELDMHLICGVFRAVECRKPLLIAANTGFSAHVDADGRVLAQGRRRDTDKLLAEVRADVRDSWYLRHGDWFAGTCLGACLLIALVGVLGHAGYTQLPSP